MIDPASKVVFGAVTSETTANGTVDKAPQSAAVEGANLLLIPGRHITRTSVKKTEGETAAEGELKPSEIKEARRLRARVGGDRQRLRKLPLEVLVSRAATTAAGRAQPQIGPAPKKGHRVIAMPFRPTGLAPQHIHGPLPSIRPAMRHPTARAVPCRLSRNARIRRLSPRAVRTSLSRGLQR